MTDYDNTSVKSMTVFAAEIAREINGKQDGDDRKDDEAE